MKNDLKMVSYSVPMQAWPVDDFFHGLRLYVCVQHLTNHDML
jgi:hypothetical protein